MRTHLLLPALLSLLSLLVTLPAAAEPVVVINTSSGVESLTHDEVINIFLGRYRQLPSGITAMPIDQPADALLRAQFYRLLVNKDLAELNAYWARLIFSGKIAPPRQAGSTSEVLEWVARTRGGIGYIERNMTDPRVKIVMEFSRP